MMMNCFANHQILCFGANVHCIYMVLKKSIISVNFIFINNIKLIIMMKHIRESKKKNR